MGIEISPVRIRAKERTEIIQRKKRESRVFGISSQQQREEGGKIKERVEGSHPQWG